MTVTNPATIPAEDGQVPRVRSVSFIVFALRFTEPGGVTIPGNPDQRAHLLLDTDPQNPANELSFGGNPLRRWALVTMGTSVAPAAIQVGQIFLQYQKLADTSGQATLTGHVEDSAGVLWPAWMVREANAVRAWPEVGCLLIGSLSMRTGYSCLRR